MSESNIPSIYERGVHFLESLRASTIMEWLREELRAPTYRLAGRNEDYPIQSILEHYEFLSPSGRSTLITAVRSLLVDWRNKPEEWDENQAEMLIDLTAGLHATDVKEVMKSVVSRSALSSLHQTQVPALLRALASLSVNSDREFWRMVPCAFPDFAGMAFQVLTRIAPADAFHVLLTMPDNDLAIGGVSCVLGDFVASFAPKDRLNVLARIIECTQHLSKASKSRIQHILERAGYSISDPNNADESGAPAGYPSKPIRRKKVEVSEEFRVALARFTQEVPSSNYAYVIG